jgi:hypothetical protein
MSPVEQSPWLAQLTRLRAAQVEVMRHAPYRDFGLIPGPGASEQMLQETEARLGFSLPTSYRDFLAQHDGWTRCFDGAALLGCQQLGKHEHEQLAKQLFCSAASPSARTTGAYRQQPQKLLVFGVDPAATTLFAFDLSASSVEPPVTAWIGELGLRFASFCDFLRGLARLCEAELTAMGDDLAAPSSAPRRRDSVVTLSSGADTTEATPLEPELSDLPLERAG